MFLTNITHYINRLKDTDHMTALTDAEKAFGKFNIPS